MTPRSKRHPDLPPRHPGSRPGPSSKAVPPLPPAKPNTTDQSSPWHHCAEEERTPAQDQNAIRQQQQQQKPVPLRLEGGMAGGVVHKAVVKRSGTDGGADVPEGPSIQGWATGAGARAGAAAVGVGMRRMTAGGEGGMVCVGGKINIPTKGLPVSVRTGHQTLTTAPRQHLLCRLLSLCVCVCRCMASLPRSIPATSRHPCRDSCHRNQVGTELFLHLHARYMHIDLSASRLCLMSVCLLIRPPPAAPVGSPASGSCAVVPTDAVPWLPPDQPRRVRAQHAAAGPRAPPTSTTQSTQSTWSGPHSEQPNIMRRKHRDVPSRHLFVLCRFHDLPASPSAACGAAAPPCGHRHPAATHTHTTHRWVGGWA